MNLTVLGISRLTVVIHVTMGAFHKRRKLLRDPRIERFAPLTILKVTRMLRNSVRVSGVRIRFRVRLVDIRNSGPSSE